MGEDGHAGANTCLGQIYRSDVALLEEFEGGGKLSFEFSEELATGDFGCVDRSGAADKDD